MTKPARDAKLRWPGFLLAAIVAVLVMLLGAGTASAATPTAAQTRVGVHTLVAPFVVGPDVGIGAGQRLGNDSPAYDFALATGVAAKGGTTFLGRLRGRIGDLGDDTGAIGAGNRLTSSQAGDMANRLGYRAAGRLRVKGQQVFTNGDDHIVQDIDNHLLKALWKRGGSYEDLFSKKTRMGTYDYDLNRIGP